MVYQNVLEAVGQTPMIRLNRMVPEGAAVPRRLEENVVVLQQPLDRIYLTATSAMALLEALDALDAVSGLEDESGADETDSCEYLGGDAPGIAVVQVDVGLADVDGSQRGKRGAYADKHEGTHAGRVLVDHSLKADGASKEQADAKPGERQSFGYFHDMFISLFTNILFFQGFFPIIDVSLYKYAHMDNTL